MNRMYTKFVAGGLAALSLATALPGVAFAQRGHERHQLSKEIDHRQDTKNQWRNLAIAAGGLGVLGALSHDNTLTFAGAAGALYSLDRYEKDRKSQAADSRARASLFSRPYYYRDGVRYDRHEVVKNGHHYYQFRRH